MLALLAVLADSHLAYRGTLTDMCDFLGVASRNSRTNNKIKDAIDALETDGLLKKITDGRTFTLTLSKKAEKERRVIRIQKEWVMVEVTVRRKILELAMSHERTVRIRDKFATDPVDPLEFDFRHIFPPKIVRQIMCNPGGKIVVYAHFQA